LSFRGRGVLGDAGLTPGDQTPGVVTRKELVPGAPGHGEGYNAGQALIVTAAVALKKIMDREKLPGTIVMWSGVAEEAVGAKAHFVRAGIFKDVDAVLFTQNFRREHLRLQQRSHYVISDGGDQPNVVPPNASVWYYFRELDYDHIKELWELGNTMANAAAMMTGTTVESRVLGSAWPQHGNRPIAQAMHANILQVGMPAWSDADQQLGIVYPPPMPPPK
jgi:aminobenzoyl-glutamate utilization protein B